MQDVSGVHTSRFHDTDGLKMALRARNVSGSFEKWAPAACFSKALENFRARRAKTKS